MPDSVRTGGGEPSGRRGLLSVLMPVHNEARTLRTIVARVLASPVGALGLEIELIAVDDASTDASAAILRDLAQAEPRLTVLGHQRNRGKGAAVRTALAHARGDIALVQDADLEYDPAEYPRLLGPILEGRADAVYGSRFAAGGPRRVLLFWHGLANRALTLVCDALNDVDLTDMETCYKAVRVDVLRRLRLRCERFGFEPEVTTRLAQFNARVYEVPISYHARTYAEGKQIGWWDAAKALGLLVWLRFVDTRFSTHEEYNLLEAVRRARRYNRWLHDRVAPYLAGRIAQAGCGIGNLTEQLLGRDRLVCLEREPLFVDTLRRRFGHLDNVRAERVAIHDDDDDDGPPGLGATPLAGLPGLLAGERLESVLVQNVVEHVRDDAGAVAALADMLPPGGRMVVLAPAHQRLWTAMDRALGHRRRYEPAGLAALLEGAGLRVERVERFNRLGALGWRLSALVGRKRVTPRPVRLFDAVTTVGRALDAACRPLAPPADAPHATPAAIDRVLPGLTLIAVARKPS